MQMTAERQLQVAEFDQEARRYYDTVTWLAEVLPGSMRTPFEYRWDGEELYAADGSAMGKVFDDSIVAARNLPIYEQRRSRIERDEYEDMRAMMRGDRPNTMVVVSDFVPELMGATEDVGGWNVQRKPTMLRVLTRTPRNTLQMYTQTLDGSNRPALEAIYTYMYHQAKQGELLGQRMFAELDELNQELLTDQLMRVYDRSLQAQYGGQWYGGRRGPRTQDTYEFVCAQQDLIRAYLATTTQFTGGFRDLALAAAVRDRYVGKIMSNDQHRRDGGIVAYSLAIDEMYYAGGMAQARGESFSGCGRTVGGDRGLSSAEDQLDAAGYGSRSNKTGENSEALVWKDGTCRIDNCPTRPGKTKVAQCHVCRGCQAWFDRGRDPSKIYRGISRLQKSAVTIGIGTKKQTKVLK
jgi:hypothetical protein